MDANSTVAEQFFAAAAQGDAGRLRALCAPGFQARQNGGPPADVEALIAVSAAIRAAVPDFRYENAVRSATASGFVEEHDVPGHPAGRDGVPAGGLRRGRARGGQDHGAA